MIIIIRLMIILIILMIIIIMLTIIIIIHRFIKSFNHGLQKILN